MPCWVGQVEALFGVERLCKLLIVRSSYCADSVPYVPVRPAADREYHQCPFSCAHDACCKWRGVRGMWVWFLFEMGGRGYEGAGRSLWLPGCQCALGNGRILQQWRNCPAAPRKRAAVIVIETDAHDERPLTTFITRCARHNKQHTTCTAFTASIDTRKHGA